MIYWTAILYDREVAADGSWIHNTEIERAHFPSEEAAMDWIDDMGFLTNDHDTSWSLEDPNGTVTHA